MYNENVQMGRFISQLKLLITSMVVKRDKYAAVFETDLEYTKAADKYINTMDYGDLWESYVQFDSAVLKAVGIDKNNITAYHYDKDLIPREYRDRVVAMQKETILSGYIEHNDYYRMLNGLPPYEDWKIVHDAYEEYKDQLYDYNLGRSSIKPELSRKIKKMGMMFEEGNEENVTALTPLWELPFEDIGYLQASGYIDKLLEEFPNRGYLKYLGKKSISIYNARTAQNYELLYIDPTIDTTLANDFKTFYAKARTYYMVAIYNKEYSGMFEYYDEFIGFCILTMAVQRLISNIYKQGLTRDFYDPELIRYLFKSYSFPYLEGLALKFQKALAKDLNFLLRQKSTNNVLYDVSYILGFYNVNIYKYYLVKKHKLDSDGNTIYDYKQMYDFTFQKVNLKETDVNLSITDSHNEYDYYSITAEDPYWVDDYELKQKVYTTNFNYMVSKYMSLDVSYSLAEKTYEIAHFIRMMIDRQNDVKKIYLTIPNLGNYDFNLFDLTVFVCALGAKRLGLKGGVPAGGAKIANLYGFNFREDLEYIRRLIDNDTDRFSDIDPTLLKYIANTRIGSSSDVDRLYKDIKEFRKLITEALYTIKDKKVYDQYEDLYRSLLIVEDIKELYKDSNGNQCFSFEELLKKCNNPILYTYYEKANGNDIDELLDTVFVRLASLSDEFKFLSNIVYLDTIYEFLLNLIRFFKSYTVDFINSGIQYTIDDHYLTALKLLDVYHYDVDMELIDNLKINGISYADFIDRYIANILLSDKISKRVLKDRMAWIESYLVLEDQPLKIFIPEFDAEKYSTVATKDLDIEKLSQKLKEERINIIESYKSQLLGTHAKSFIDIIVSTFLAYANDQIDSRQPKITKEYLKMNFDNPAIITHRPILRDELTFKDSTMLYRNSINLYDNIDLTEFDYSIKDKNILNDKLFFDDIDVFISNSENLNIHDKEKYHSHVMLKNRFNFADSISSEQSKQLHGRLRLRDTVTYTITESDI